MTNQPHDGDERDAGDGAPQADPDHQLTQPVQPYDRPAPPPSPSYGPPPQQQYGVPIPGYGQPGQGPAYTQPPYGQPPYGPGPYGQPGYGPGPYAQPQGYGPPYRPQPYGPSGPPGPGVGGVPVRKSRRRLYLGLVALAALLVLAMFLADVLGPTVLNRAAVERDVGAQFEQREGVAVDLTCDEEMRVETGEAYGCTGVTADGEEIELQITITDENFAEYTWTEP